MAKARAIVKRRKAVRNIRKITKTMQMIATAKFQKSQKRASGTKPYTRKVRELVAELAASLGGSLEHPLLRTPVDADRKHKVAVIVITSNRGLAGAYNGSVLRAASAFLIEQEKQGSKVDLFLSGKKGVNYFTYQKRPIVERYDEFGDLPQFADVDHLATFFMDKFISREYDAVYVAYMNFITAGQQKPEVRMLLPLGELESGSNKKSETDHGFVKQTIYDFYPEAGSLLDELLPQKVKAELFQAFLDAVTSENIARMVSMKSATDNADKMVKSLTMQYNRARQSQITTELSEIMGGVEAMKN